MNKFLHYAQQCDPSWKPLLNAALNAMDQDYLGALFNQRNCLPAPEKIFNAFTQPLSNTHTILFGESPYPRNESANGYAFWDANVHEIWSTTGLSKPVNRATSLRNFIKMLLVTEGRLEHDTSQPAIAALDKTDDISTLDQLFQNMLEHGFLLLNTSLVLSEQRVTADAKAWEPFMQSLLMQISEHKPDCQMLLFGNIAKRILALAPANMPSIIAEHPYNISFIQNETVQNFFRPYHLLRKADVKSQCATR